MSSRLQFSLAVTALVSTTASAAPVGWDVTVLGPGGRAESWVAGGSGAQQVGTFVARWTAPQNAVMWSGSQGSMVNLNPPGADWSQGIGATGGSQYGTSVIDGRIQASRWNGTAASWVSLEPAGMTWSWITAVGDGQQVGYASNNSFQSAYVWSGTAESARAIPGAVLNGVGGGVQVGYTSGSDGWFRAGAWRGTPESFVDLHPAGSEYSQAWATDGTIQGGYAMFNGVQRAGIWRGSADSWVDLTPGGATSGWVLGAVGGFQVGVVMSIDPAFDGAAVWNGSAESYENLALLLEGTWSSTWATSAWIEGDTLFVGGYGYLSDNADGGQRALLWSRTIPAPASAAMLTLAALTLARRRR